MAKYRKRPVEIEAVRWTGFNKDEITEFCSIATFVDTGQGYALLIPTLEGSMEARPQDYIIKGIAGEFYPCKPDIFHASYERI